MPLKSPLLHTTIVTWYKVEAHLKPYNTSCSDKIGMIWESKSSEIFYSSFSDWPCIILMGELDLGYSLVTAILILMKWIFIYGSFQARSALVWLFAARGLTLRNFAWRNFVSCFWKFIERTVMLDVVIHIKIYINRFSSKCGMKWSKK